MKTKISKALAVILSILMLFSAFPVFALTEGNRYSFEEKHLNAYYSTGQWTTADGHVHDNSGQVTLRWLKDTGEPLYCIQIYNGVDATVATATGIQNTILSAQQELYQSMGLASSKQAPTDKKEKPSFLSRWRKNNG